MSSFVNNHSSKLQNEETITYNQPWNFGEYPNSQ